MARAQHTHFPLIDGLRAFAAVSVVVYHFIAHWDWEGFPQDGPLAWFRGGWMAVDLFFVISGFVIGLSAFGRLAAEGPGFRAGFLRGRLLRIVPLHYVTLLAFVVLVEPTLRAGPGFWPDLLAHLLFVHNLAFDFHGAINGPNWSLGTEMQFYLLVAVAAPWLARVRPWRLLALGLAIAWAWRCGVQALLLPGPLDRPYMAQTQLPGMLDEFAIGLLLARFVRAPAGQRLLTRLAGDMRLRLALAAALALAWWALQAAFLAWDYWDVTAMAVLFRTAMAAWTALALLLLCAWPARLRGVLRVPAYLGQVSYGLYLWHLPVLIVLGRHTRLEPLPALGLALAATLALAALTWHVLEQPVLLRWGRPGPRRAPGRAAQPACV